MKFEKLNIEEAKLEKAEMSHLKGGTSTTEFTQTGVMENEQEVDEEGNEIGDSILIDMPI